MPRDTPVFSELAIPVPVSWQKLHRTGYFCTQVSARTWCLENIHTMSSSSSFCWVKIILLVEVLHNGCWINSPVTIPEGRMEFIWIRILKLIKAKSATPERGLSLQNFVMDHDFLLTLLERSKLCFSEHKSFIRFFMMGSVSSDSEWKKIIFFHVVSGVN